MPRRDRGRAQLRRAFALAPVAAIEAPGPHTSKKEWDWRAEFAAANRCYGTPGAASSRGGVSPSTSRMRPALCSRRVGLAGRRSCFPIRARRGELVAAGGRYIDGGETPKARAGGSKGDGVFVTPGALEAETVVVVEGPLDALSLAAAGVPALALWGTSATDWLASAVAFRRVALALDADEAGEGAVAKLAAALRRVRGDDRALAARPEGLEHRPAAGRRRGAGGRAGHRHAPSNAPPSETPMTATSTCVIGQPGEPVDPDEVASFASDLVRARRWELPTDVAAALVTIDETATPESGGVAGQAPTWDEMTAEVWWRILRDELAGVDVWTEFWQPRLDAVDAAAAAPRLERLRRRGPVVASRPRAASASTRR